MFSRLSRSFISEWALNGLVALLLLLAVLLGLQLSRLSPLLLELHLSPSLMLKAFALLLPVLLVTCLPLAGLAGLLAVLARWGRDGEWLALRAAGVGRLRLSLVVLPVSLVIGLPVFFLGHQLAPTGLMALEMMIRHEGLGGKISRLEPGRIVEMGSGNVLTVGDIDSAGSYLRPFISMEADQGRYTLWAREGRLVDGHRLVFKHGGFEHQAGDEWNRASFDRLELRLDSLFRHQTGRLIFAPHQLLTSLEMKDKIAGSTDEAEARLMSSETARRNATAFAMLVFGMLSLCMAGHSRLNRLPSAIAGAAAVALSYYLLERLGLTMAEKAVCPAYLGPWLPVAVMFPPALIFSLFGRR